MNLNTEVYKPLILRHLKISNSVEQESLEIDSIYEISFPSPIPLLKLN